jgi:hypothetical protein
MTAGTTIPAALWPELSARYGLHPRDVWLPPEQGGLTFEQAQAYVDDLDRHRLLGGVFLAKPSS